MSHITKRSGLRSTSSDNVEPPVTSEPGQDIPEVDPALVAAITAAIRPIMETIVKDEISKFRSVVEDEINVLRAELKEKDNTIQALELRVAELEQYSRRNAIRVTGIPENEGEDTDHLIIDFAENALDVALPPADIDRSHRTGPPQPGKVRPILCKFVNYHNKSHIMRSRKKLRG